MSELIISVVGQKGGTAKSTLARAIAREYAASDWSVKIADMDLGQSTNYRWHQRRLQAGIEPSLEVSQYKSTKEALLASDGFDLLVFDGAGVSTRLTLDMAVASQLVVIPTGLAVDDLEPSVRLANDLSQHVKVSDVSFALCRVGNSQSELEEAQAYIGQTRYHLLDGYVPERTGYRRASDLGRTITETSYPALNERADQLIQSIVNRIEEIS